MIIRTNSHSRLPLQASVRTSPNPIMAGGHTPAIAPLIETAFAASANSDSVCARMLPSWSLRIELEMLHAPRLALRRHYFTATRAVRSRGDPGCGITYEGSHLLTPKFSSRLHSSDCTACCNAKGTQDVPCVLRSGASRVLQGSVRIARQQQKSRADLRPPLEDSTLCGDHTWPHTRATRPHRPFDIPSCFQVGCP